MKLAICIPAFNEEHTIGEVISAVPKQMPGITAVRIFVADDGSADETAQTAREAGERSGHDVEVLPLPHKGLAGVFLAGIQTALDWGADVIVNIDADGQYRAEEIPQLIDPILNGEADMVIGDRQVASLEFMPAAKKYGNLVGSWFLRRLTGSQVRDASSGFRAYSRKAAESIEVHSKHTYTHENLIQAHYQGLHISQVPVTFIARPDGSSSRLIRGVLKHIFKSLQGIFAARRRWMR